MEAAEKEVVAYDCRFLVVAQSAERREHEHPRLTCSSRACGRRAYVGHKNFSDQKINPWKTIVRAVGRALTAELSEKMEAAQKSQDQKWEELKRYQEETRRLLDDHVRTDDERNADLLRSRILRFNNELVRGIEHTQEDFDEILCIIDDYRTYCKSHEEYKNNKCTHAIANIERCYDERLEKHDFL